MADDDLAPPPSLGNRWKAQAIANIDDWGNQQVATLLLAAIEELGEVAMALQDQADPGDTPEDPDEAAPPVIARDLIQRMAVLGRSTRGFLEANLEAPAGDDGPDRIDDLAVYGPIDDVDAVQAEVDDLGPLLWQLSWALSDHRDRDEARGESDV